MATDSERMDWLTHRRATIQYEEYYPYNPEVTHTLSTICFVRAWGQTYAGDNLRSAVDHAIAICEKERGKK